MWCPNKRATPTCVRCGGNPGILQEGSRGRSLECRPSTSHVDSLPLPSPDRLRAAGHCPRAGTEAQRGRTPRTLPRPGAGRRAEVTRAPKEMANRKCPYCNSPSPNPPGQPRSGAPAPGAARAGRGSHPTSGPRARSSRESRAALPGHYFSGPSHPAWAGPGLHAARVPLRWEPEQRRGAGSRGSKSNSPVIGFRRARPAVLCPLWLRLRDAASGRSLPQDKLLTPHGVVLASVPHPREPTLRLSRAPGTPPRRAPILHGTKMSRRATGQPPPRPTPSAGRTRCLRAARSRDSPSARPPRRGGEGRAGPGRARHNMAEHRSCSRGSQQPPPGHPAVSRQRQLRWRPPQHHIPLPPARFLPSSPPRCHGNAAPRRLALPLLPSRLPRPAPATLPPPTRAAAAPPSCPEGGWGKVASGRAGRARKARRGTPKDRAGRAGGKMKRPRLSPEGPMGGRQRRGVAAEWTSWRGTRECPPATRVLGLSRRSQQPRALKVWGLGSFIENSATFL